VSFSICQRAPCKISIHALREEGDPSKPGVQARREPISIHALREEGDARGRHHLQRVADFYPRPPRGGRPASAPVLPATCGISIHALREEGDLASKHFPLLHTKISIHALREEGDLDIS